MGDVVFAPMYEVLKARGVKFEFFHAVTGLKAGATGVDSIDYVRQADLASGVAEYEPLRDVKGLPSWPNEALWDQLEPAARGVDFEAELNPLKRPTQTLKHGIDFDEVVLGIPVGALDTICADLINRNERFARGIKSAVTVRTQAFQLWSNRSALDLGWEFDQNSVAGCYVEPLDTYCDMSHLIPREDWKPADQTRTIGYFCGVLDEPDGEDHDHATDRVKHNAIEFIEHDLEELWPKAFHNGAFDWDVLVDRDDGTGPTRFDSQYWRANTTPWERYVLTPAGTVADRLPSGNSGFANLKLAGDWTATGIDGGCVEAAVISGMDAARAITGDPMEVPGKSTAWLQPPRELPPYIEFGGRATAPSPFACQGGTMRTLLLEGKADAIAELVDRMFNVPAGRGVVYRSFGSHVMMMMGNFKRITSLTQPFDRWGAVRETQASFWIPVLAGHYFGGIFIAERLLMAVPYVFVDNPMSYLGGRETFGYAKVMGRFHPELGLADHVMLEAFGGDFGRMEGADWRKFLELSSGGQTRTPAQRPLHTGTMPLVQLLMGNGTQIKEGEELVLGDLTLGTGLIGDLFAERMSQIFLKQFRDATDGKRACYQAVVEAPVHIQHVEYSLTERDWTLTVHPLDSHPIHRELGITTQQAKLALDMKIDFVVENGFEVSRVVAPGGPVTRLPPAVHDGPIGLVEGAVRWAWREIHKHI
jgi:hypothetical protein